jgi:hypothetical protein
MQTDSLIVGLIVLLLCGAACFYLYIRMSYVEKKMSMLEALGLDLKMALDSLISEAQQGQGQPMPISPGPMHTMSAPVSLDAGEAEVIPEEEFYSSVLAQATDAGASGAAATEVQPFAEAVETLDAVADAPAAAAAAAPAGPDYDSMTRPELNKLCEQRGLRTRKNMSRVEVLAILRRSDAPENQSAGAENVSGSTGAVFQTGASLDGDFPVDLGQGGSTLESSA